MGAPLSGLLPHLVAVEAAGLVAAGRHPRWHLCLRVVLHAPGAQSAGAAPLYLRRHRLALLLLLLLNLLGTIVFATAAMLADSICTAA